MSVIDSASSQRARRDGCDLNKPGADRGRLIHGGVASLVARGWDATCQVGEALLDVAKFHRLDAGEPLELAIQVDDDDQTAGEHHDGRRQQRDAVGQADSPVGQRR